MFLFSFSFFFFNDTATTEIYTLSLHDALPILFWHAQTNQGSCDAPERGPGCRRSEEHTSELQSQSNLVCRLLLEKKKKKKTLWDTNSLDNPFSSNPLVTPPIRQLPISELLQTL